MTGPGLDLGRTAELNEPMPSNTQELKGETSAAAQLTLSPMLSPNQRSLILHQWREIMSEEISLRHYHHYLEKQQLLFEELERNLKILKRNIFCTNYRQDSSQTHSTSHLDLLEQHSTSFLQRSHSLQSLNTMPASWILAVQSAAYSDILDGTSAKTNRRAVLFNRAFFDQLDHFKQDRRKFQNDFLRHLQSFNDLT